MKKVKKTILIITTVGIISLLGYVMTLPKWLFPSLYPTYIETLETNWDLALPNPVSKETKFNSRSGFHGDGDAITELHYENDEDIKYIKSLSNDWISSDELDINQYPDRVQALFKLLDEDASYLVFHDDGLDYIILQLKGGKLIIYESYI